ncbi:MAG: lysylphosphatidylglycerol synthase transmembrane domain-containing protein [Rhizomicrobium sp.]
MAVSGRGGGGAHPRDDRWHILAVTCVSQASPLDEGFASQRGAARSTGWAGCRMAKYAILKSSTLGAGDQDAGFQGDLPYRRRSYLGFALRAVLGVAIVTFLVWRYDARSVLRLLAREQPGYFAAAVGVYVSTLVISAYRWRLLAAILQLYGPFTDFLAFRFIATFTNTVVPGVLGGDALRAIYLGRRNSRFGEAFASVIADRIVGLIGLFWLAAIAAIFLNDAGLSAVVTAPPIGIGLITLAAFLASPLVIRVVHMMPPRLGRYASFIVTYLEHPGALLTPLMLSVIVQSALAVCQYLLARGIGFNAPFSLFLFCVPIAGVFASLPLTVNGLGVREGAYLVLFSMAGVGRTNAIALGLLWFVSTTLGALPGVIAFAFTRPAPAHINE